MSEDPTPLFRPQAQAHHDRRSGWSGGLLRLPRLLAGSLGRALAAVGQRLGRTRPVPWVQQLADADCAAACLAMVLGYHGRIIRLDEVREALGTGREGSTAADIVATAGWYGLWARGVRIEPEDFVDLDPGSILHWDFTHFVVFERIDRNGAIIVDPAVGRRRVSPEELDRSFTGVALIFEPGEGFTPGGRPTASPVRQLLRRLFVRRKPWVGLLTTSLLLQGFALGMPLLLGLVVDRIVPQQDLNLLGLLAVGMLGLVGVSSLTSWVRAILLLRLRTRLDTDMTLGFLSHLLALPYAFFGQRSAGDLMMRVNSNTFLRELLTTGVLTSLLDGLLVTSYLVLLVAASPRVTLLALALGALQVVIFLAVRRRERDLAAQGLTAEARSQSYLVELLGGIETLKAMGSEPRAASHWAGLFTESLNVSILRGRLEALVEALLGGLRMGSPIALLLLGAVEVIEGRLSLGTMLALNALAAGFLAPLSSLVGTALRFQLLGGYLDRLQDVLETPAEQAGRLVRPVTSLAGQVTLEQVSFRYSPRLPWAVAEVSVDIRPGQHVAIVGRSGAGKTTLAYLMLGLYLPVEGRVRFDGQDLGELDLRSLRTRIGIVPQAPRLFGGSILSNIALADPQLPREDVIAAAQLAGIHDDIAALPMGYETLLADGGASLAGGQRQRLALARALVRRPAVLLLDEATSALDALTEARIQAALDSLRCTRITIAHRLSTVARADLILVLEEGRLVEQGRHGELLARGGLYAALVAAQLRPDESRNEERGMRNEA